MSEEETLASLAEEIVAEMRADVGKELIRQIKAYYPVLAVLPDREFDEIVAAWVGPA